MVNLLTIPVLVPLAAALLAFAVRRLRNEFTFLGALVTTYFAVRLFIDARTAPHALELCRFGPVALILRADVFSAFVLLAASVFCLLVVLYSFRFMRGERGAGRYYGYILLTIAAANGACLAQNFFLLLVFWSFMVAVLYGLLLVGRGDTAPAANKALTMIAISDFLLLLGVALLFARTGRADVIGAAPANLRDPLLVTSYLLLALGCFGKAGAFPFHTWIPEVAGVAPAPTLAYIPASLDKLLGIYLLVRVSVSVFDVASAPGLRLFLLIIGSITILAPVLMALVQKDAMRLLAFDAVSQVGYMLLGIGSGNPIGLAGALFHMLNHAVYKSALFLTIGSVEDRTRTTALDRLGGLGGQMPVTLVSFLVAALAISGVPPLNGFYSKWMIYQGLVAEAGKPGNAVYALFLIVALFGSVLTVATMLRLLHAVFLGRRPAALGRARETGFVMWIVTALLALVCIGFGIGAALPLRLFIYPSLALTPASVGVWSPVWATVLIVAGIVLGLVWYLVGTAWRPRRRHIFTGGEQLEVEAARVTGLEFYGPVRDLFAGAFRFAEGGAFDLYGYTLGISRAAGAMLARLVDRTIDRGFEALARLGGVLGRFLSGLHAGELPTYVVWLLAAAALVLLLLVAGVR